MNEPGSELVGLARVKLEVVAEQIRIVYAQEMCESILAELNALRLEAEMLREFIRKWPRGEYDQGVYEILEEEWHDLESMLDEGDGNEQGPTHHAA
jgi:hypothetical protein